MIKAIILDVDGVIIGEKVGFNFPDPHPDVIQRLKKIRGKGIYISLCTAKPSSSIQKIIEEAKLDNLHITNGGSLIIDPIDNIILIKHVIPNNNAIKIIQTFLKNNIYTEFYSAENYFIQENQKSELTETHISILQTSPITVNSLINEAKNHEVVKIMPISKDEEDKKRLIEIFKPYEKDLTLSWGIHPVALPHQFGIITAKGISKKQAAMEISDAVKVKPKDMLGIGDSTSDWQFIKVCGYGGAMGNATNELKNLVLSKGKEFSYIGRSVNENGVLDILNYFL